MVLASYPLITRPTRIGSHSSTLIDNFFSSSVLDTKVTTGIIPCDISDHLPTFMIESTSNRKDKPDEDYIFRRKINKDSMAKYHNILEEIEVDDIYANLDPQQAFTLFNEKLL